MVEDNIHDHLTVTHFHVKSDIRKGSCYYVSIKPLTQISLVTSIPRLWASLTKTLNSFMASSPELRVPLDEYLDIGEKKFVVEYPQKFILAQ